MSARTRLRFSFELPDAAAEWAGAALSDLFPDGLLLTPIPGGVSRLQGWLPEGQARRRPEARRRLGSLGARRVRSAAAASQVKPAALHGRFPVLKLGRFVVVPKARAAGWRPPQGARPIVLVQGQAFGTGLHESTRLMLRALERLAPAGLQVLDVGSGSAILGFACLHLGAHRVTCVEMEGAACAEARENRALNGVAPGRLPIVHGRYPLARLKGRRWPLVLGNLVTPVLEALMPRLASQTARGGALLCSGIHTSAESARVKAAARKAGLRFVRGSALKSWHVLQFARP